MSDQVTVTREQLRRAIVAAWTDCIPAAHLSFDEVWRILETGEEVPDDITSGRHPYGYDINSADCWGPA